MDPRRRRTRNADARGRSYLHRRSRVLSPSQAGPVPGGVRLPRGLPRLRLRGRDLPVPLDNAYRGPDPRLRPGSPAKARILANQGIPPADEIAAPQALARAGSGPVCSVTARVITDIHCGSCNRLPSHSRPRWRPIPGTTEGRTMRKTLPGRGRDNVRPPVRWRFTGPISDPLTWDIQVAGRVTVVAVDGELDVDTAPRLSRQLTPLADKGSHLILDLAGLRFCDCAGLSLFLRLQRHASAVGGSLHLTSLTVPTRR